VIGEKDALEALRGKWIFELAEYDQYRGHDAARLKAFLSSSTDRYRPSYGRRTRDFARQCVFIGSTNEDIYLVDRTGNRRVLPVRVGLIDVDRIRADRDQLWAEAVAALDSGATWYPDTKEFQDAAKEAAAERVEGDPWEPLVADWLKRQVGKPEGYTCAEVLVGALAKPTHQASRADETRMGKVLRELGFEPKQSREGLLRIRRYRLCQLGQSVTDGTTRGILSQPVSQPVSQPSDVTLGHENPECSQKLAAVSQPAQPNNEGEPLEKKLGDDYRLARDGEL
jgi:predicted P-loop ATPase